VGLFATKSRSGHTDGPGAGRELSEAVRQELPTRFEAVGEALASGSDPVASCDVAGRSLAQDGASLEEALTSLRDTYVAVSRTEPAFAAVQALSVAWSEATLAYLHGLSCEDPLTGLSSLAHVRSRLSELYRRHDFADGTVPHSYALVVVELPEDRPSVVTRDQDRFSRSLRLARLGETARTVFPGHETIGRLGSHRVVVLAERDDRLGRRTSLLRTMLLSQPYPTRLWIEGLPSTDDSCAGLLDELVRD
jgi:hypothetical protein